MLKGRHRKMPAFSMSLADETATAELGATLAARLRPGDVVGLQGELGSGKTTLARAIDRKSTRLNSSYSSISYAVFCLKKKKKIIKNILIKKKKKIKKNKIKKYTVQ